MTDAANASKIAPPEDWISRWQRIARRIRVPLGFLAAILYLYELWRRAPMPWAILWSLVLVLPGLWLRGYAAGYVKKNRELTQTGPYAHVRNPLYLGSVLIAFGFAFALLSWPVALVLAIGFLVVYVPVIASEERYLRATFPDFDGYCKRVPRLVPRLTSGIRAGETAATGNPDAGAGNVTEVSSSNFSFALYLKHREYNALIGAAFLYLSLIFLGPALGALVRWAR
jgi:protein-S-isoprenylcysteine O-methyltransferase Ste14